MQRSHPDANALATMSGERSTPALTKPRLTKPRAPGRRTGPSGLTALGAVPIAATWGRSAQSWQRRRHAGHSLVIFSMQVPILEITITQCVDTLHSDTGKRHEIGATCSAGSNCESQSNSSRRYRRPLCVCVWVIIRSPQPNSTSLGRHRLSNRRVSADGLFLGCIVGYSGTLATALPGLCSRFNAYCCASALQQC